jgi:F-type H+-transporting ATPase subunit gamma
MGALLRHLVASPDAIAHPLFVQREVKRVLIVVVTADRGLCGGFNSNIIKAAIEHIRNAYPPLSGAADGIRLMTVGKKGNDFFAKRDYTRVGQYVGIFSSLHVGHARGIVDDIIRLFLAGQVDRVDVIYNEFKNVIQQRVVTEQFLPILPEEVKAAGVGHAAPLGTYIYEPSAAEIINALIPKHLNFQMWRILLESNASEQGARMTAMGNATENAKELLQDLRLSYNNARQAGITKELLEITSGSEALKQAS